MLCLFVKELEVSASGGRNFMLKRSGLDNRRVEAIVMEMRVLSSSILTTIGQ